MKKTVVLPKSANEFKDKDGVYRFPFEPLDQTLGGSNLGRIEWHCEFVRSRKQKGRYHFTELYVWATQTRDRRYAGKYFSIPCFIDSIQDRSLIERGASFTECVWSINFCRDHGNVVMSTYPENHHRVLSVNVGSSIQIQIRFEK